MYFETFILITLFQNAKLNIKKKQPKFSQILGRLEKGKQTSFFLGLINVVGDFSKFCIGISHLFLKTVETLVQKTYQYAYAQMRSIRKMDGHCGHR